MEITPLGDSALIVRVCDSFEADPAGSLARVLAAVQRLELAKFPEIVELTPAYTTVAVFYDPARIGYDALEGKLRAWLEAGEAISAPAVESRVVEIPVVYGGEFGPDLEEVAQHVHLSPEELIKEHTRPEYRVHCLGFSPGFPYLGGLPIALQVPRRTVPRTRVPAGSVGIGGVQTGVYPLESPGGWHLIGRTPRRLFDVSADPPTLLRAGDLVRFRAVSADNFQSGDLA